MNKKTILTVLSVALILCVTVGGTLAFLIDKTDSVKNTFTYGDINIELEETTTEYKMIPGNSINKDPKVTVLADSEACLLFVKIEESENFDDFMFYTVADGWTQLTTEDGSLVYYREVAASDADQSFDVLNGNLVSVSETVTKADLNALTEDTRPTLTFTAYAVQKDNMPTAEAAWNVANV